MKLSTKIPLLTIMMIVLSVVIIAGLGIVENLAYNKDVNYERVDSSTEDLGKQIQLMLEDSRLNAVSISHNFQLINAIKEQDFEQMKAALDDLNQHLAADTISITDLQGNVLIRQHEPSQFGDNIMEQANVQQALGGEILTTLEPGALVELSCRSGAPIIDETGSIIGTVVSGYSFEKPELLDELKALHNTELTIFGGDIRIATTIMQDGERVVGTPLDKTVAKIVLEEGKEHLGKADILGVPYITKYVPLKDTDGKIVGAVFAGLSEEDSIKATWDAVYHMVIAAVAIILVCIFILLSFTNRNIRRPMQKLTEISNMLAEGRLDVKIDELKGRRKDEVGMLADAMHQMVAQIKTYISDITHILTAMSENDFTVKSAVNYEGDFEVIGESLEGISCSMNRVLLLINAATEQVNVGASQVASGAQSLASGSSEQASSIEELGSSIAVIARQATENSEILKLASQHTVQANSEMSAGNEQMTELTEAMVEIESSSNQIANITKVIEDIAFQTNILALNAAIEAAHAGSAGKGFAVVAEEVRSLAAESAKAAKQTGELIQNSVTTVAKGTQLAALTAQAIDAVGVSASAVLENVSQVEQAFAEQVSAIDQIDEGLNQVSSIVQTNAAIAEENSATSEQMSAQAAVLREQVENFKLNEEMGAEMP